MVGGVCNPSSLDKGKDFIRNQPIPNHGITLQPATEGDFLDYQVWYNYTIVFYDFSQLRKHGMILDLVIQKSDGKEED